MVARMRSAVPRLSLLLGLPGLLLSTLTACENPIYSDPGDGPVMCSLTIDDANAPGADDLDSFLDRAKGERAVVHLYAHKPGGGTVSTRRIEKLLSHARRRGLSIVTYRELAEGWRGGAALALSFDDAHVDAWYELRSMLASYHAHVTFFVSKFEHLTDDQRRKLHDLEADGHDIEFHGSEHRNARTYVAEHGMDAYFTDEIEPGLAAMRADGFDPIVFAYPFGARTAELDAALESEFALIRATSGGCPH
jgi:hypothetical protein